MHEHTSQLSSALASEESKLLACVHCGLCLEACPTYVHTANENDSPRGRIYLMRAVEEGRLALRSQTFTRHIDRCLGCRACESACPAGVEYGQLLEAARSDISDAGRKKGWTSRLLHFVLRNVWLKPSRLRLAFNVARVFRDSRLPHMLLRTKASKLLPTRAEFALALLDSSASARLAETNTDDIQTSKTARVQLEVAEVKDAGVGDARTQTQPAGDSKSATNALLFEGCVTEGLFSRVNRATEHVLEANGCATRRPRAQVCCGALHAHAGDLEGARILARQNIDAFEFEENAPVLTNAGGCGAMLVSYAHLLANDASYAERARAFSARVRDVSQQLAVTGMRAGAPLEDLSVTYDASCHLLHGQGARVEPLRVLGSIEGLRLAPLEGSDVCCGGAGVYNLLEEELSTRVLEEKLRHVAKTGAEVLATGNPGCHMQIGAGARLRGMSLKVVHPVEVLYESYKRAGVIEK